MSDEELNFSGKKKKSKKPFDLDGAEEETAGGEAKGESVDLANDDLDFNKEKKKKKKPKKTFNLDELESGGPEDSVSGVTEDTPGDGLSGQNDGSASLDISDSFFGKKKKKKERRAVDAEAEPEDNDDSESTSVPTSGVSGGGASWANSDRDYTYEELLTHVFSIIKEKNPDIIAGEKKKLVMRPPQVLRVGTKKTSFANFLEICKSVHRSQKHMQAFLLAELGTSGSVDANNQLIIKGRFQQKQIESVLRRYIKEYVACQTCRSPETILQKDTRLFFLQCETCGSRRSVASIKSGYQALVGKRAATRAKGT